MEKFVAAKQINLSSPTHQRATGLTFAIKIKQIQTLLVSFHDSFFPFVYFALMEPLSALSVATAVTQFLDFTGAVLSSTWKIYISNDDDFGPNPDIVTITKNLNELNGNLRHSSSCSHHSSPTKQDQDIERLCGRCVELGDRLITVLNSLQSQSKHRLWGSFRQALGTIWNQTEIDSLQQTLANYRQQITMYLLVHLRYVLSHPVDICLYFHFTAVNQSKCALTMVPRTVDQSTDNLSWIQGTNQ